jgi:transaldolase
MQFFIDSADLNEIRQAKELGCLDGVTTNPSLIAKVGKSHKELISQICQICTGPVSCEVIATDFDTMMKEAREIAKIASNVVVKIPLTQDGLQAVAQCTKEGIQTNVTLCFNSIQALLAAKAGATYISPFIGRLDDIGQDGMECIREIRQIYDNYDFETQILAASIRNPIHIRDAALEGADVVTVPFSVLSTLIHHPLTRDGLEKFLRDAEKIPKV